MGSLRAPWGRQRPYRHRIGTCRGGTLCLRAAGGTGWGGTAGLRARRTVCIQGGWARRGPVRFPMPFGFRVE